MGVFIARTCLLVRQSCVSAKPFLLLELVSLQSNGDEVDGTFQVRDCVGGQANANVVVLGVLRCLIRHWL